MSSVAADIRSMVVKHARFGAHRVTDDSTVDELGLDSLATAEMLLAVEERLGRRFDVEALDGRITPRTSVRELVALLEQSLTPC